MTEHRRDLECSPWDTGEYFDKIAMIDGKPRSATVNAAEPMRTLAISHADFQELVKDEPEFARGLLLLLCARLREAESRAWVELDPPT